MLKDRYLAAKRRLFEKALSRRLNPMQCEAVLATEGPVLVLAGAGSGKTTVLVNRVCHIIKYGRAYSDESVPPDLTEARVAELEQAIGFPLFINGLRSFRDMTERVSQAGLPVFVTEYGVTAASGGLPRDLESADAWIELLERERISYCMWSFSKVNEACSAIRWNVPKYSGFAPEDYTDTGLWLLETLKKHTGR